MGQTNKTLGILIMALGIAAAGRSGPLGGPRAFQPTELSRVTLRAELQATDHHWMPTRVKWQNAVGVAVAQNTLTKTAAGGAFDAGASSVQTLWSGDGYVEFTTLESDKRKIAGLSNGDPGVTDTEIDFAIRLADTGAIGIRENGVAVAGGPVGTYVAGDVFRVGVEAGQVVYRQNGVLLYVSTTAPTYPLLVDASLFHLGATIVNARIASPCSVPVRWTEAAGVTVHGNRITKTAPSATWDSGAASVQQLDSGDGYVQVIVPLTSGVAISLDNTPSVLGTGNAFQVVLTGTLFTGTSWQVIENGSIKAGGTFAFGDQFRICVEGGVVKYRQNGALLYTSLTAPIYPLRVGGSINTPGASLSARVSGQFRPHIMHEIEADLGDWGGSQLTPDLLTDGPSIDYGISGTGPLDLVAGTGRLSFSLNNSEENAEGTLGYYSPQHVDLCDGFAIGIDAWYLFRQTPDSEPILKFTGRLKSINPEPGKYGSRRVACSASDWMDEAASTKLNIPVQVNKRVDEIMALVIAAIPSQPLGTSFAPGDSTFPYMVGDGDASALTLIQRLYQSEYARCYLRRGILTGEKRTTRLGPLSTVTFDGTMQDLDAPTSTAKIKNKAKVTIHPRRVDVAATTVLFSLPSTNPPEIEAGATITLTARYTDPSQLAARVGGMDMVTPVSGTDYQMNAAADGSGTDLTADCAVSATYAATQVDYSITNSGGTTGYIVKPGPAPGLQARGRGIYDYDPIDAVELDQASIDLIGENTVTLDMPYQSDLGIAQPVASFLVSTWVVGGASEASIEFIPRDAEELEIAMGIEPGDALTVREELTGINNVFFVQHVSVDIDADKVSFKWSLQRALIANYWQVGVAGYSEVGITTVVGPF